MTAQALILYEEPEAARFLHISQRTLRSLRSKGKIRYVRPSPRKVLYSEDDLAEYIKQQSRQDEPPCPSTNPPKAASGNTTSGSKVVGITALRAAKANATRKGTKTKSDGRQR